MGKPLPWVLLHRQVSEIEGQRIVENLKHVKQQKVTVSNTPNYTVCSDSTPHTMRNRVASCASPVCAAACVAPLKCRWRCKVLTCQNTGVQTIYELGTHEVLGADPPSGKLTIAQKKTSRQLAANGLKPARIRNALADGTPVDQIPHLNKVQNFVTHFRKKELNNTDELDVLERIIKDKAYCGLEEDCDAFSFSCNVEANGEIAVGEGTNNDAFLVGFTTKTLLKRLDRDPQSFIFHFDATYKFNQVDYPTFVREISDHARWFHLVALFVASQQEEWHYSSALASLRAIYARVLAKPMKAYYIFVMLTALIHERSSSILPAKRSLVVADVFDMHYAKTAQEFHAKKTSAVRRWLADPDVEGFGKYFLQQWLKGKFDKWQCFRTPIGWATTNNPMETFNAKLKNTYTLWNRMLMGALLGQLQLCCRMESISNVAFHQKPMASERLRWRATALRRQNFLVETPSLDVFDDFVLVVSKVTPRIYVRPKKPLKVVEVAVQLGANGARMERDEQPEEGWSVDVTNRTCPCKYFNHKGQCVHLLFALYMRFGTDQPGKRKLVDRSRRNKRKTLEDQITEAVAANTSKRGRPILNGPALGYV